MNRLRCATLTVGDVDAAAARFARWLDYQVIERGVIAPDLATAWGTPASTGRDFALCRPASGTPVFIRFVAGDPIESYRPIRTHGWAAIEICVQDVIAVDARMLDSPFAIIGPPARIAGLPTIHPMQVCGPDREIIYFTQILTDAIDSGLPHAQCPIDTLFILVLACADMPRTARWFADTLGLEAGDPASIRYSMISKAFALPADTQHAIVVAGDGHDIFLEFDQYPSAATPRPAHTGALPPGVSIGTLLHPDFDRMAGCWSTEPVVRNGPLYAGRRSGILRTPEGALIELIEGREPA